MRWLSLMLVALWSNKKDVLDCAATWGDLYAGCYYGMCVGPIGLAVEDPATPFTGPFRDSVLGIGL